MSKIFALAYIGFAFLWLIAAFILSASSPAIALVFIAYSLLMAMDLFKKSPKSIPIIRGFSYLQLALVAASFLGYANLTYSMDGVDHNAAYYVLAWAASKLIFLKS